MPLKCDNLKCTPLNDGMYYFRDSMGNEGYLITKKDGEPVAIEIKTGTKANNNMLRALKYWQKYQPKSQCILLHGGKANELINERMSIVPWTEILNL